MCGGVIIDKEWILSAAHCLPGTEFIRGSLYAGITDNSNLTDAQIRYSDYIVINPKYPGKGAHVSYDLALLHLDSPLVFTSLVKPIALPFPGELFTGTATLYGWGKVNSSLPYPHKLQTVETDILEYDECKKLLPADAQLSPLNICSSSRNQHISACSGDSGGPLVKENLQGVTELVGIVSWIYELPCAERNLPTVYTQVSDYVEWIVEARADYYRSIRFCKGSF